MADKDGPTDVDTTMSAKELLAGPQQWPETDCRRGLFQFLEGGVWALIVTFFTFWALFAPDLIQVLLPKEADKPCAVVTLLGFIVFFFEIILNFVLKRDYGGKPGLSKLTWFLLIDIVGTASLIPDFLPLFDIYFGKTKSAGLARAGRAARIGARLSRLVRMFRMNSAPAEYAPDGTQLEIKASNIGTEIADVISTRVVLLVMLLIILLPVLTYSPAATQSQLSAEMFDSMQIGGCTTGADLEEFAAWYNECDFDRCPRSTELVFMEAVGVNSACGTVPVEPTTVSFDLIKTTKTLHYDEYRVETEYEDIIVLICDTGKNEAAIAEYITDAEFECPSASRGTYYRLKLMIKANLVEQSTLSLFFMLFAVIIIGVGAGGFLSDVQDLVITPIERMTSSMSNLKRVLSFLNLDAEKIDVEGGSEMDMLGNSIQKMIGLLNIGFGEAGTEIIEQNLGDDGDEIDPLIPGKFVDNIYVGFIMLENFGAVTDVMEEDIMLYANYIGEVIHKCIGKEGGNPNKVSLYPLFHNNPLNLEANLLPIMPRGTN
jgi:hypothetical protein